MKPKSIIMFAPLLTAVAVFGLVTAARADAPAFVLGSVNSNTPVSFTGSRGWAFEYIASSSQPLAITQLGVFDSGGDGLVNSHQVGFWSRDGTLLASVTVPSGTAAPLVGGYRFVQISPIILQTTDYYLVAAQFSAGDADDLVTPIPAGIGPPVFIGRPLGFYGFGSNLPFPSIQTTPPCPDCSSPPFWEANFQFVAVPEPSTFLLLGCGVLGLLVSRGKSS